MNDTEEGWLTIGKFQVCPWSISGIETCMVIKAVDICIAFDMGYSHKKSIQCEHVFISHGHMDHVSGVIQHAARRDLYKMKPAKYYVPAHLVDSLQAVTEGFCKMAETPGLKNIDIVPVHSGKRIDLPRGYYVEPFPTIHRVRSNGYLLYKKYQKLKPEFRELQGFEIGAKKRCGMEVYDITEVPEVAYMGDTTFDVFLDPPINDLLKVKLLITETTYIDDEPGKNQVVKAREWGHSHLFDFVKHEHLFQEVESILFMHFSNKYSPKYIKLYLDANLPESLKGKVFIGTIAKENEMNE